MYITNAIFIFVFAEMFNLEFIEESNNNIMSSTQAVDTIGFKLHRAPLRDASEPSIEPVPSSAQEPMGNIGLLMTQKVTLQAKIACFMPGLSEFQHKWYLTVIEDSEGVRLHPQFIPASQNVSMSCISISMTYCMKLFHCNNNILIMTSMLSIAYTKQ